MRAVIQRVERARVVIGQETVAAIGRGLCVLLGVAHTDTAGEAGRLAGKVARLRIFEDETGKFDRSLLDVGAEALVVSQFTLIADYRSETTAASPSFRPGWRGNRPSFTQAAKPEQAEPLHEAFCDALAALGPRVAKGVFGARMEVELVNDGPVTIILEV